ncbi:MAG: N-acetylmannosaminyltransferase TarA [Thermacetogenium phaeum]|uniref:N-acetylglucosaminyldiphosphoundecaprenol N-acetyl-beta-D-mannosaminyltransferase n=1 Tax=Thermacetogenium phaeum TaxID=85874 RepID=A0A101FG79_9THEO|nr:MAG: N-acetylmannosaminyltransferase TarA [Thermacetogenium phaeum]
MTGMPPERRNVLGVGIHPLTLSGAVELIGSWINSGSPVTRQVVTLNPEMLYRAQNDPALRDLLNGADLVVPDGHGIVWAGRRLGCPFPERVAGIDLISSLAEKGARQGWRFYLLGAKPGVAAAAAENLCRSYPGLAIVGAEHGYFGADELSAVLAGIRAARPDLLLVGLGSPRQEFFIWAHRRELGVPVAIGVGGSFDVISGRLKRAPRIWQRLRLEWLFRAIQEPRRWRRLMVLPSYVLLVLRQPREGGCRGGKKVFRERKK